MSWADAADAAIKAASINGCDTWYIGYNHDMAEQYIHDVGDWAKAFNLVASDVHEVVLEDEDKDILVYRIRFASGYKVSALSSRPANLRAKEGRIVIDEAAFHDDFPQLLKAAMAIKMWGGQVCIISTHNGIDNPFNQLIEEIRAGEKDYSLHRITISDALAEGLYKRICLVTKELYSLENEFKWIMQLRKDYGVFASEELDCEPSSASAGKFINRDWFKFVSADEVPAGGILCRGWDFAATAKELKGDDPDYTVGCLMRRLGNSFYITDLERFRKASGDVTKRVQELAASDGKACKIRWEIEPGSAGKSATWNLASSLPGYDALGVQISGDKQSRAKAFANAAYLGNVYLVKGSWNKDYLNELHQFPDGDHDDQLDGSAIAFNALTPVLAQARSSASRATF